MISHHRQFFMDIKAEHVRMEKMSPSPAAKKMYEALDLSRRRDSVETRKTPSPYNSSSFGENSPPMRDSPSTTTSMINNYSPTRTPLHHYTLSTANQYRQSPPNYPNAVYTCQPKRETPSPTDMNVYSKHSQQSCTISEDMTPYMLQAAALHQRMTQQQHTPNRESDESSETSSFNTQLSQNLNYPMVVARDGKLSRPFKAYPRDPLSITASFSAADTIMDSQSAEKYNIFRQSMLKQIHAANGGSLTISNPKMRRTSSRAMDCESKSNIEEFQSDSVNNNNSDSSNGGVKDSAYYERRKKNNAAAKKSRDRRRIKEDELAIRTAFLERENIELKIELASARKQLSMYGVTGSS